jgi:hypothetical protein
VDNDRRTGLREHVGDWNHAGRDRYITFAGFEFLDKLISDHFGHPR